MSRSDRIAEALFECVMNAPDKDQEELFAALNAYRTEVWRSYEEMMKRRGLAAKLISAMEEVETFVKEMNHG